MVYPNTANQKGPMVYPLSTPAIGWGVDETGSLFPAGSGFRRSEALERQTPRKFKVVPQHMCTIVLLVVNGQDPTPGFDRLHRHQFLPSEFMEVELETPPSGEPEGIL